MAFQGHPRSLILKRACNFLLVIDSKLGPILSRFRDIAGFLLRTATAPIFHPNFGGVAGVGGREEPTLINPLITFELTQLYGHGT